MKKINNNQGHTIPIVLVIVIVLTIITSSIVYAVSVSTKKTNNQIIEYTNKLEIENTMYEYLNKVVTNEIDLGTLDTNPFIYNDIEFKITLNDNTQNIYSFKVSNDNNYVLNATIDFNTDSYNILKWGFVKE